MIPDFDIMIKCGGKELKTRYTDIKDIGEE